MLHPTFLRRYALESKKDFTEIANDTLAKLVAYHWPPQCARLGKYD